MQVDGNLPSSFRDPSGFLFRRDGVLFRRVNIRYKEHYDQLMDSGLYDKLVTAGLLVSHVEVDIASLQEDADTPYKVIQPEIVPFISYPHEWCFSQLKHAALATLEIQKTALDFEMSLKDASAYNIQYKHGRPVLIDTLSFEKYREGQPWIAYRQFCQHFLAPLALMSQRDVRLSQLFRIHIDGVPLDLASSLLPIGTLFKFGLLSHVHFHAKSQKQYSDKPVDMEKARKVSRLGMLAIIDSLSSTVKKLKWSPRGTEWADYYEDTNYSSEAFDRKKQFLSEFLEEIKPESLWDVGANTGVFSRIASEKGIPTISFDIDPSAVEVNYLECVESKEDNILPLLLDLTNPSPAMGWENLERMSFLDRAPADAVLALALIHHLVISNNVPLGMLAGFFGRICNWLIIEFVPKADSQVQRLLQTREDIFPHYTQDNFEAEFGKRFQICEKREIEGSDRALYLMKKL
jgi:ribosomal protein L11 methylase PrmA